MMLNNMGVDSSEIGFVYLVAEDASRAWAA